MAIIFFKKTQTKPAVWLNLSHSIAAELSVATFAIMMLHVKIGVEFGFIS